MVHKPGIKSILKVFVVGKMIEERSSCGLHGLYKMFRINAAVEQLVTLHEKSFRRGTKAILFYLNC